jgi:hypothetical protein
MNTLIKLEEWAIFILCIFLFSKLNFAWWWFPALLFLPDIGFLGYVFGSKVGAFTYNLTHYRFVAALVALYAYTYGNDSWKLVAIILFAHISFDRAFGYGLKYPDSPSHTHLGWIGNEKHKNTE